MTQGLRKNNYVWHAPPTNALEFEQKLNVVGCGVPSLIATFPQRSLE